MSTFTHYVSVRYLKLIPCKRTATHVQATSTAVELIVSINIYNVVCSSTLISCLSYGVVWAGSLWQLSKLVLLKWSNSHSFVSHLFIVVSSLREFSVKLLIEIWLTSVYCIVYSQFAMQKKEIPMWGIKSRPHR